MTVHQNVFKKYGLSACSMPSDNVSRFLSTIVDRLCANESGETVAADLNMHYQTGCSRTKMISRARTEYLQRARLLPELLHPRFSAQCQTLLSESLKTGVTSPCVTKVKEFVETTPVQQNRIMRMHGRGRFCWGQETVDAIFRQMRLFPDSMVGFVPSDQDNETCDRRQNVSRITRNSVRIVLPNATGKLEDCMRTLRDGTRRQPDTMIALLFVSGRRSTEILSHRSQFQVVVGHPHHTFFIGQLKKHGTDQAGV